MSYGIEALQYLLWQEEGWKDIALQAGGMLLGCVVAAIALVPVVSRMVLGELEILRLGKMLGLRRVLQDRMTLQSDDGSLTRIFKVQGLDLGALSLTDRRSLANRRTLLFSVLSELDVHIRVFGRRRRIPSSGLPRRGTNSWREAVVSRWEEQFKGSYENEHFIVLTVAGATDSARERLDKATEEVHRKLSEYGITEVIDGSPDGVLTASGVERSDLLSFWAWCLNPASPVEVSRPAGDEVDLGSLIAGSDVMVSPAEGQLSFVRGGRTAYAYVISVDSWDERVSEELAGRLMAVDGELLLVRHFHVLSETASELLFAQRLRATPAARIEGTRAHAQFSAVGQMIEPGAPQKERLTRTSFFVLAYGETAEEAEELRETVIRVFDAFGIVAIHERQIAPVLWWTLFPGHERHAFARGTNLLCATAAYLAPFETPSDGSKKCAFGNGWCLRFRTVQGTPYHFNFHADADPEGLGHTIIFGPPGQGKTTLVSMLQAGALEHFHQLRAYNIDRHRGLYVYTTALGGRYVGLLDDAGTGPRAALNPLRGELTTASQAHLLHLQRLMTGLEDPESSRYFEMLIKAAAQMRDPAARDWDELVRLHYDASSRAMTAMKKWLRGGPFDGVFNAPTDSFPIDDAEFATFDFTAALSDAELAAPLVDEVTYRVSRLIKQHGVPAMLVVDEAKRVFSHPYFRQKMLDWLEEMRKVRCSVITLWQRPSALGEIDERLPGIMRSQNATWIFFRDEGAKISDYDGWNLSDFDWQFITRRDPGSDHLDYACLVKKPATGESVILNVDNRVLGELASLFRSGQECSDRAIELQQFEAEGWIWPYLEEFAPAA